MKKAIYYYEMLKPYIDDSKKSEAKEVKPPRGEGRWIKYANLSNIPEFVIKNANINVVLQEDVLDVNVKDFSSNQKLYKKAMVLKADAQGKGYENIVANLIDDRRGERSKLNFDANAKGFTTDSIDIQTLVMENVLTDVILKGEIVDQNIQAKSRIKVNKATLQMPSQELVNTLLKGITRFSVDIGVQGMVEKPSIEVKTDLDRQLAKGLKGVAAKAGEAFEKELQAGVMKKVGDSGKGISADLGDVGSILSSKQSSLGGINLDFTSSSSNPLKGLFKF